MEEGEQHVQSRAGGERKSREVGSDGGFDTQQGCSGMQRTDGVLAEQGL